MPRLVPELEIVPWRRSHVLAIQVYASAVRPHYIQREGLDRGVYVRVGSTNRRADRELIDELRRFARGRRTTNNRCRDWTRKRWTSERLPSRLHLFAAFGGPICTLSG